jgi:hypothetical protein
MYYKEKLVMEIILDLFHFVTALQSLEVVDDFLDQEI